MNEIGNSTRYAPLVAGGTKGSTRQLGPCGFLKGTTPKDYLPWSADHPSSVAIHRTFAYRMLGTLNHVGVLECPKISEPAS